MDEALRAELLRRMRRDQDARRDFDTGAMQAADGENLPWLKELIAARLARPVAGRAGRRSRRLAAGAGHGGRPGVPAALPGAAVGGGRGAPYGEPASEDDEVAVTCPGCGTEMTLRPST